MKLKLLVLSATAAGLAAGCNPDPRPSSSPTGNATPVAEQPRTLADANSMIVYMNKVTPDEVGQRAGTVTVMQTEDGLQFTPNVLGLTEGQHGFHIHQNPSCEPEMIEGKKVAAAAAGGHYDPENKGQHTGPHGDGHKGDLPMIEVDSAGNQQQVTIKDLSLDELKGRSLVVHMRRDDYSSNPAGDSGPRIACGIID
ncbi:superoxide dismutase family protein [Arsukibacterium sp.]|uniref:superoxide dismutase family protein n=1 Tax=Arsukibacterium sp. TaxID=1977258 RepID=UPI00356A58D1